MPKNPAAHNAVGHRSGYNGNAYGPLGVDRRLDGYGNPPSDPEFQKENPGGGRLRMSQTVVTVDDIPADHRPPESRWVPKPAAERVGQPLEIE